MKRRTSFNIETRADFTLSSASCGSMGATSCSGSADPVFVVCRKEITAFSSRARRLLPAFGEFVCVHFKVRSLSFFLARFFFFSLFSFDFC